MKNNPRPGEVLRRLARSIQVWLSLVLQSGEVQQVNSCLVESREVLRDVGNAQKVCKISVKTGEV